MEGLHVGLLAEHALVEGIAEETEAEDCEGEEVAGAEGVTAKEAGEGFVVVFWGWSEWGVWRGRVMLGVYHFERRCWVGGISYWSN